MLKKYITLEEIEKKLIYSWATDTSKILYDFADLIDFIHPKDYWKYLRIAYENSDNLFATFPLSHLLFQYPEGEPKTMMEKEELCQFQKLPEKFEVYRGMSRKEKNIGEFGFSWTLDRKTAEFFAFKYNRNFNSRGNGVVVDKFVTKSECLGLLNDRKEQEIILKPSKFEIQDKADFNTILDKL